MKKYLIICLVLLVAVACNKNQARISVNVNDMTDSTVVIYKLNYNYFSLVDTVKTDADGHFDYNIKFQNDNPAFYYVYTLDQRKLAGMILLPGDNVTVNTGSNGVYTVEGSQESLCLKSIDDALAETNAKVAKAIADNPDDASSQVTKLYIDHKRNMLKHIANNPHSITSATVVFQKIGDMLPVFGEHSDAILFKSVYDSLKPVYPNSEYLVALLDEINNRQKKFDLDVKASAAEYVGFPDLVLPDVNGKEVVLSKSVKKVTIVSFWTVSQTEHKMFNHDLMELYAKYGDKGLEIYQISLDDKPTWAATIKSQNLPWISVNDGLGVYSPSLVKYNVTDIPTMYVIDKEGTVCDKDVFDIDQLERIIRRNLN
ncbi:MAG: AhpC/TSA family protein [Bacteroidales bacterium]|nr:AhpC/TSA family protein [Bacteroidales bacterium]